MERRVHQRRRVVQAEMNILRMLEMDARLSLEVNYSQDDRIPEEDYDGAEMEENINKVDSDDERSNVPTHEIVKLVHIVPGGQVRNSNDVKRKPEERQAAAAHDQRGDDLFASDGEEVQPGCHYGEIGNFLSHRVKLTPEEEL